MIADAGLAQGGFQRARLLVGAEEDGLVAPGNAARQAGVFDLLGGAARLLLVVGEGVEEDFGAAAFVRPELFAAAAGVVFDDGVGGGEDGVGGAVILLQRMTLTPGKCFSKSSRLAVSAPRQP